MRGFLFVYILSQTGYRESFNSLCFVLSCYNLFQYWHSRFNKIFYFHLRAAINDILSLTEWI